MKTQHDTNDPRAALRGRDVREALAGEVPVHEPGDVRDASGRSIAPPQTAYTPSRLTEAERSARARELLDSEPATLEELDRVLRKIRDI